MSQRKVNLFVVGAAKCGTTSLYGYFEQHPAFYTTRPKEPRFFAKDIPEIHRLVKSDQDYDALYSGAPSQATYLVDASPAYMYSACAAEEIYRYNSHAHVVIMVRPPADLIYSVHAQYLWSCDEDIPEFRKAWEMRLCREKGLDIPKGCRNPMVLAYHRFALLGEQAERYFMRFPRNQIHVILFDDLKRDSADCFRRLLSDLGVQQHDGIDFSPRNVNARARSRLLARWIHGKGSGREWVKKVARKIGVKDASWLWRGLTKINEQKTARVRLEDDLRREIEECYEDDVRKLEALIGVRLPSWREAGRSGMLNAD